METFGIGKEKVQGGEPLFVGARAASASNQRRRNG